MGFRVNRSVTARGWGKYLIMQKDRHVATIREDGSKTRVFGTCSANDFRFCVYKFLKCFWNWCA